MEVPGLAVFFQYVVSLPVIKKVMLKSANSRHSKVKLYKVSHELRYLCRNNIFQEILYTHMLIFALFYDSYFFLGGWGLNVSGAVLLKPLSEGT